MARRGRKRKSGFNARRSTKKQDENMFWFLVVLLAAILGKFLSKMKPKTTPVASVKPQDFIGETHESQETNITQNIFIDDEALERETDLHPIGALQHIWTGNTGGGSGVVPNYLLDDQHYIKPNNFVDGGLGVKIDHL